MFTATLTIGDLDFEKPEDAAVALLAAAGTARPLSVALHNQHTGEKLRVTVENGTPMLNSAYCDLPVRPFLDVSTGHLSPAARAWLSESATLNHAANYHGTGSGAALGCLGATLYGWFMTAPTTRTDHPDYCDHGIPDDLALVIEYARSAGCFYILFDADDPVIEGLPVYDD